MMRTPLLTLFFFLICCSSFGIPPKNDQITGAITLTGLTGYCSEDKAFSNQEATASGVRKGALWLSEGRDLWYRFTAQKTDINITVTGKTSNTSTNTLIAPLIAVYTYDGRVLTEMIGSMASTNNLTTAYKGGLIVGTEYYIRISAEQENTGTFKLCINNYNPPVHAGQDCATASLLCSKETFSETNIAGAGNNSRETAGTCLETESNAAWYKWTAANNGSLTFSITPTSNTDDIDWVLFDLGPDGDCSNVVPANAIRCASGNGINCTPSYFITGLNMTSTDVTEQSNCLPGQDGWLKYIDMTEGHTYALLINNFSSGNNGFTLAFGGTGEFEGPQAEIMVDKHNLCDIDQRYIFSVPGDNIHLLEWNFGADASISQGTGAGPHAVTYQSAGQKNISLKATNNRGCSVTSYYNLYVANTPATPVITASSIKLCIGDVLKFSTSFVEGATYYWSGPNQFSSSDQNPELAVTGPQVAGDYRLTIKIGECISNAAVFNVPAIPQHTIPRFRTSLDFSVKYAAPVTIRFINESLNATSCYWDFGDGESSAEMNPTHTYTKPGSFNISLTSFTENNCSNTTTKGQLVVLKDAALFVPDAFSPNGDGINDELKFSIPNLKTYQLLIVNRWGVKIFESNNIFQNWDGRKNGQDLPVGTYYYIIDGKDVYNVPVKKTGSVMLLR